MSTLEVEEICSDKYSILKRERESIKESHVKTECIRLSLVVYGSGDLLMPDIFHVLSEHTPLVSCRLTQCFHNQDLQ